MAQQPPITPGTQQIQAPKGGCSTSTARLFLIALLGILIYKASGWAIERFGWGGYDGPAPESGMYHWQAQEPTAAEWTLLDTLHCQHLYQKAFDVVPHPTSTGQPVHEYQYNESTTRPELQRYKSSINRYWVVYITNSTLYGLDIETIPTMAGRIVKRVAQIEDAQTIGFSFDGTSYEPETAVKKGFVGLQLDCDWSPATRDKYFLLLKEVKKLLPKKEISTTLRLWQYKNQKLAGIPPADRVTLMLYNMSPLDKPETENSIFKKSVAETYLKGVDEYRLPLDVAIPTFQWAVWFRDSKYQGIVYPEALQELRNLRALKAAKNQESGSWFGTDSPKFQVVESITLGNQALRLGDELRLEQVTPEMLLEAQALARSLIKKPSQRLLYFSLSPALTQQYTHETLAKAYSTGR